MTCPTPAKLAYPSKRSARRALAGLYANGSGGPGRLHVYRCAAGHWHVGHTHY